MQDGRLNRDRWATLCAGCVTIVHAFAGLYVFGWYYLIAPRLKQDIDKMAAEISETAMLIIMQSDVIVNYWCLIVVCAPPLLMFDFLFMRWITQRLGVTPSLICGAGLTLIILMQALLASSVLHAELRRLQGLS